MSKVMIFISIVASLGAGFGSGFLVAKKKYEARADKEIASVKDACQKHIDDLTKSGAIKDIPPTRRGNSKKKKTSKSQAETLDKTPMPRTAPLPNDVVSQKDYKDYSQQYRVESDYSGGPYATEASLKQSTSKEHQKNLEPYVISPDEYMSSEYEAKSLIYYADKVLADDDDNIIPNPMTLIGRDALTSFGRYENDSVYVRDDNLKVDYEVILSQKPFHKDHGKPSSPKQSLQSDDDDE